MITAAFWWAYHKGMALPMQADLVATAPLGGDIREAATELIAAPKWTGCAYQWFCVIGFAVNLLAGFSLDALIL